MRLPWKTSNPQRQEYGPSNPNLSTLAGTAQAADSLAQRQAHLLKNQTPQGLEPSSGPH